GMRWWGGGGWGGYGWHYWRYGDDAHAILRSRYARGEITREQFEQMMGDLEQHCWDETPRSVAVQSREGGHRGPDEPGGEGEQAGDRKEEDRPVGLRDAPLRLPQSEGERADPEQEAREEADEDRGAELADEDETRGEPPEDRIGTREVHGQPGGVRFRVRLRRRSDDRIGPLPNLCRAPCEIDHDARAEEGDEGDVRLDARDDGACEDRDGQEDRVRGRRADADQETRAPRSRYRVRGDDRVHGARRRREGQADPDAGEDRHEHVEGHGAGMSRGIISVPREPL